MRGKTFNKIVCAVLSTAMVTLANAPVVHASEYFIDTTQLPSAEDWGVMSSSNDITNTPAEIKPKEEKSEIDELPTIGDGQISPMDSLKDSMPETPSIVTEDTSPETGSGVSDLLFMTDANADTDVPAMPSIDDDSTEAAGSGEMKMPSLPEAKDDTSVDIETPSKASGKKAAEEEYSSKNAPETEDIDKPTVLKRKEAPSTMETTKWDISGANRSNKISVNVFAGETRFEMFYSANASIPAVTFTSIDGNIYRLGEDFNNGRTRFISRPGNKIDGNSDVNYCVMYISAPTDPGSWTAEITLDKGTKEFMLIKSQVPTGWADFVEEYRTKPEGMCLWGIAGSSDYSPQELTDLANVDTNPGGNTMTTVEPDKEEPVDYTIPALIAVFAMIIIGMITATVIIIKRSNDAEEARKQRHVNKANKMLKKRQEARDNDLASALRELDEDFSDDEYFKDDNTYEDEVEEIEVPVQKNAAAYDELTIDDEDAPSMEDVMKTEETVIAIPSWLSEDNTAAGFF